MIKQNNKPNITVFVGRSEQSDLRHLTFCRSDLRQKSKKVTKIIFFQPQKTDENNPQTQTETNIRPILLKVTVMSKKVTIR